MEACIVALVLSGIVASNMQTHACKIMSPSNLHNAITPSPRNFGVVHTLSPPSQTWKGITTNNPQGIRKLDKKDKERIQQLMGSFFHCGWAVDTTILPQ